MSADWVVFIGATAGVCLFVFGRSAVRAVVAWFRPDPLANYRWPYDDAAHQDDWWR